MNWTEEIEKEIVFTFSRSAGPGGQNVNKLATKVDLAFDLFESTLFNVCEKELIALKLKNRINKNGVLRIQSQKGRTQGKNKFNAFKKLIFLIEDALIEEKPRKRLKPNKAQKEKRLKMKKQNAYKKQSRKKVNLSKQIDLFSFKSVSFV